MVATAAARRGRRATRERHDCTRRRSLTGAPPPPRPCRRSGSPRSPDSTGTAGHLRTCARAAAHPQRPPPSRCPCPPDAETFSPEWAARLDRLAFCASSPSFSVTTTCTRNSRRGRHPHPAVRRASSPVMARRPPGSGPRLRPRRPAARAAAARGPSRSRRASRARTACRTTAGHGRLVGVLGQNRDESGVSTSSIRMTRRRRSELELVSARMIPRSRACRAGLVQRQRQLLQPFGKPFPTRSTVSSKVSGRSWPVSAFVVGVKIGSDSCCDSTSPAGSSMPHTAPVFR